MDVCAYTLLHRCLSSKYRSRTHTSQDFRLSTAGEGKGRQTVSVSTALYYQSPLSWHTRRLRAQAVGVSSQKQIVCYICVLLWVVISNFALSNAPKYRLVVRFTNKEVICQIVYARLQGDHVLVSARSGELPRYGINHGLTNWAAGMI